LPQKILDILGGEYKLGYHKAAKMAQIGIHAQIWAVTDLDDEIIKKALMKPYSTIQSALNHAVEIVKSAGKQPRVVVMPSGSLTIPLVKK
jgi:nickel-dependent lactate racemase